MAGPTATNPKLWLKADAGVYSDAGTTLAVDGDPVRQWNDQSGNGNHASQATAGSRPVYHTSQWNGRPGVRFNRLAGTFAGGQYLDAALGGTLAQPVTVFVVARTAGSLGGYQTLFDSQSANENALLFTSADKLDQYAGTDVATSGTAQGGLPGVYCAVFNGASSYVKRDGVTLLSGNVGAQSLPEFRLGANNTAVSALDGLIYEALVYGGTLGAEEADVLAYLKSRWFGSLPANGYMLAAFANGDAIPSLYLFHSYDALTWSQVSASYFPAATYLRDPTVTRVGGAWWLAHTNVKDAGTQCSSFSVASSPDGTYWSWVADVDCSSVTGAGAGARAWAPEWFLDATAPQGVRLFVALSSTGDPGNFQIYETHPTNAAFTTWSAPAALTGTSLPSSMIDPFMVKAGSTYYLWYKNETTKYVEVMSSSSLTSGYTVLHSGDWMGIGANVEGPSLFQIGGTWHLWVDRYLASGISHTTQTAGDWTTGGSTTWGALSYVDTPFAINHGTVFPAPLTFVPAIDQELSGGFDAMGVI